MGTSGAWGDDIDRRAIRQGRPQGATAIADEEVMATRELRQHLRVQSESRAVLILADGSRIKCQVRDVSLGGAYLMQCADYGAPVALQAGDVVQVWLFHPGRAHEGPTVDACIVRAEDGGPGIALRFTATDNVEELVEHVAFEAQAQKIPRGALGVPVLQMPKKGRWRRAVELGGPIVHVSLVGLAIGTIWVVRAFLNAVL
jgi:hypothetical protein